MKKTSLALALASATLVGGRANAASEPFQQMDLVSDQANQAAHRDADLVNPWGLVVTSDGLLRVADEASGKLTSYRDNGRKTDDVVVVHGQGNPGPTGLVLNTASSGFRFTRDGERRAALLIAVGTNGSIAAFNPRSDRNNAVEVAHRSDAAYLGAAIAERN